MDNDPERLPRADAPTSRARRQRVQADMRLELRPGVRGRELGQRCDGA